MATNAENEENTQGARANADGGPTQSVIHVDGVGLQHFDPNTDPHSLAQRWRRYIRSFQLYITGKGISNEQQKKALLLHTAGPAVQDIFFALAGDNDKLNFDETNKLLESHFTPKTNVPFERHAFRQLSQSSDETIDQFYCRLRSKTVSCEFENVDEAIRDQLIDKCYSNQLRRKLLEKEKLTLENALETARALEAVNHRIKEMEGGNVKAIRERKKQCFSCGHEGHFARDYRCPARNQRCANCGRIGHFKAMCRSDSNGNSSQNHSGGRGRGNGEPERGGRGYTQSRGRGFDGRNRGRGQTGNRGRGRWKHRANAVDTDDKDGQYDEQYVSNDEQYVTNDEQYVFTVSDDCNVLNSFQDKSVKKSNVQMCVDTGDSQVNVEKTSEIYYVNKQEGICSLNVGGVCIDNVLIDSGASRNVMSQNVWEYLKSQKVKCQSRKAAIPLYAYGQNKLDTLGVFKADVMSPDTGNCVESEFVVVKGSAQTLLGKTTAEKIGLLRIGPINPPVDDVNKTRETVEEIVDKYPKLFSGVGLLKNHEASLNIDETKTPVAQPVRRIPFALRDKVEEKIKELLKLDIIEKVEKPSSWISPLVIVSKPDGDIRVCVDMRQANEAIVRERHPIPTVDEILYELNGSKVFSKLDLKWGFHQIGLEPESRYITTFATHLGIFQYKRLFFGVSSAPELYQKIVRDVLDGCEGVANIADDIIVHGKDVKEHDRRLKKVLLALQESGMTLNSKKCEFSLNKLVFFGHELTSNGINPSQEKVEAVMKAQVPKNAREARSFMGLVQFSAKFLPNLSTVARPIQELTRKGVDFVWGEHQEKAFRELKRLITSADTLAYFDVKAKTRIVADASPVGLGAVLTQYQDSEWRVIAYASRSLTDVESRYSQTEKEALALVWACERFNLYVFGHEFELETDHKPLEQIYSPKSKTSARIERWILRLQSYNFKVIYRPGKTNIADALSRLNGIRKSMKTEYDSVRFVVENSVPVALSAHEIEQVAMEDVQLQKVRNCIMSGNWDDCSPDVTSYKVIKDELTVYGGLVLRGDRIVIPVQLRKKVLDLAHEGHQGIVKTKQRLRTKVWWPKIDKDAEKLCRSCYGCQIVGDSIVPEPMARSKPTGPWQDCAADLLGPLPNGENLLLIVDYYSRFYEVVILRSTTSEKIIEALIPIFSRFGVPFSLKTDNGPQFVSEIFENFLTSLGIEHRKSPPLWPQANGEVEIQNRTLMKSIRIAHAEKKNWKSEMYKFLEAYRSTPQCTTGASPYFLMFNREMRTKLPDIRRTVKTHEEIRERDWEAKMKGKFYSDTKRHAKENPLQIGESVLVKAQKTDKLSTNFDPVPRKVINREGSEVTVQSEDGVQTKRHLTAVKKFLEEEKDSEREEEKVRSEDNQNEVRNEDNQKQIGKEEESDIEIQVRNRPCRIRKTPSKFKDFVVGYIA